MSTSTKLPPTGRDFLVYQRLVVDGATTRAVADEVGVSQTRVRQIVIRVTHWLVESLTPNTELSESVQLRLGQHIAADRLERFYVQTNRAWNETAQPKFANLCLRVIAAQAKLPTMPGTIEALLMDAIAGPLPDDIHRPIAAPKSNDQSPVSNSTSSSEAATSNAQLSNSASHPPSRDCSPSPSVQPLTKHALPRVSAPTPAATKACDDLPPAARSARSKFLSPAQILNSSTDDSSITECKITPEKIGLTVNKNLSRKARRRLSRMALAK